MNRSFLLSLSVCLCVLSLPAYAQQSTEANTLFGQQAPLNTKHLGFFLAPSYGITTMDGSTASLLHLRGGLSVQDKFAAGGYFQLSLNEILPESETVPGVYLDFWSVGGFAEYTLLAKKVIHLTFPLYFGYGEVEMDNEIGEAGLGEANFWQVEPSALLEVNLHKNVRLNLGGGYRFISQMEYRNFDQSDLSGLTGYVGLKFGLFK